MGGAPFSCIDGERGWSLGCQSTDSCRPQLGEASWTEGCKKRCDCPAPGTLRCESAACPEGWRCGLLNGSPECVKGKGVRLLARLDLPIGDAPALVFIPVEPFTGWLFQRPFNKGFDQKNKFTPLLQLNRLWEMLEVDSQTTPVYLRCPGMGSPFKHLMGFS